MDLLFVCKDAVCDGGGCRAIDKVYGEYKTPSEQPLDLMKVSQLDPERPVVVDTCGERNSVKQVSRECRFFIPNNPAESSFAKDNIETLRFKKIYVLKPDVNIKRLNYPALYEGNENVTGKKYKLLMEELDIDRSCYNGKLVCNDIKVVSHKDNPINLITFKALLGQLDSAKLDRCKQTMAQMKQSGNDFNDQYSDLLKQALFLQHFSGLVRQFEDAKSAYITALEQYKTIHTNRDHTDIDCVLAFFNTNTVKEKEEIDRVISTISEYQMISSATHPISNLKFLSKEIYDFTYNAMKQKAEESFDEIADLYNKHFFVDKTLNTFLWEHTLTTVGSINKYSTELHREVITKATPLTEKICEIAEKITALWDPNYRKNF